MSRVILLLSIILFIGCFYAVAENCDGHWCSWNSKCGCKDYWCNSNRCERYGSFSQGGNMI